MKKIFVLAILILTMAKPVKAEPIDFYSQLAENLEIIQIYEPDDLTADILENRNGAIIIEKIIGKMINESGDGIILNTSDPHNYISYKYTKNAEVGDIILTYCIYNPDSQYEDDIIDRFDYIIDRAQ